MKDCNLEDYLFYRGVLVKCVGVNEGYKEVTLLAVEEVEDVCPHCNKGVGRKSFSVIVTSPNFQNDAEPIKTITSS